MNLPLKKRPLRASFSEHSDDSNDLSPKEQKDFTNISGSYPNIKCDSLKRQINEDDRTSSSLPLDFPTFSPLKRFKFDEQTLNYYYGYNPASYGKFCPEFIHHLN